MNGAPCGLKITCQWSTGGESHSAPITQKTTSISNITTSISSTTSKTSNAIIQAAKEYDDRYLLNQIGEFAN